MTLNTHINDLKSLISVHSSDFKTMSNLCEFIAFEYYQSKRFKECKSFLEKCLQLRSEYLKIDDLNEVLIDSYFRVLYLWKIESGSDNPSQEYFQFYEKCLFIRRSYDSSESYPTKLYSSNNVNFKTNDLFLMDSTMIYCFEAERSIFEQDYNKAEVLFKFCLKLRAQKYGVDNVAIGMVLFPYAEMLTKIGFQYNDIKVISEAIEFYERCIRINKLEYGNYHNSFIIYLTRLVTIYREKWEIFGSENDLITSKSLATQLLSIQDNVYGANNIVRNETISLINSINREIENLSGTFLLYNKAEHGLLNKQNDHKESTNTTIHSIVIKYLTEKFEKTKKISSVR